MLTPVHSADHCAFYRIYGCEWKITHKCTFFFVLLLWMNSNGKQFTFIQCFLEQVSVFIIQPHANRYFCTTGLHSCVYLQIYLTFRLLMCTFGRAGSLFEFCQWVLLVEVKVSTLKVQFVSLSAHFGNAENTFQHLWTNIFLRILCQPNLRPLFAFSA